jgi:ATP-binding cassette, subfamily B (MDR/TAP), member 7
LWQTYQYGAKFALITGTTMAAYTAFTILTTSWRTKFRKQANAADNRAATVAVDSLINYEAVKVSSKLLQIRCSTDGETVLQQ